MVSIKSTPTIVIFAQFMDWEEIGSYPRDMKNITKIEIKEWSFENAITYIVDR